MKCLELWAASCAKERWHHSTLDSERKDRRSLAWMMLINCCTDLGNTYCSFYYCWERSYPKFSDLKPHPFYYTHSSDDQELRQDIVGMICLCSLLFGASGRKAQIPRSGSNSWRMESPWRYLQPHVRHVALGDKSWSQLKLLTWEHLYMASPCGLGFLTEWWLVQKESVLREKSQKLSFLRVLNRSSTAFSNTDLEITQHHFSHIAQSQRLARFKKRAFRYHFMGEWQCHIAEKYVGLGEITVPYWQR